MSSANSLRVLELESQNEVLERLQLLSNFGSSLITVTGPSGAGKTWIAQRYLEAWAEEKNQALLMCFPNQDDEQRRATILSQISSQTFFDPSASLADNISGFYQNDSCNIVIVVDDAQLLSETLISELWMLVLEAQSHSKWSINVILFSLPNLLDTLLTRLSYGQEHKPVDVEIDTLSADDADRFFEFYVMRYVEPNMEKRVRNAYSKVRKTPGDIMALGEQKMEKRVVIRSIIGSPLNIAIIVVLLLVLIGGGYYWMLKDGLPEPAAKAENSQQTAIPTLSEPSSEIDKEKVIQQQKPATEQEGITDDADALPPEVTKTVEQVGVEDTDRKRVIISSDVVDALLDGESLTQQVKESVADTPPASEPIRMAEPTPQQGQLTATPESSVTENNRPTLPETPARTEQPVQNQGMTYTNDELMSMSDRSYTLQLGAFNTPEETVKFMQQYQLLGMDNIYIYQAMRNGVRWIIVTYNNYPTIQVARDAVEMLTPELQRLGPWAKSLRQVHRDIDSAK